MNPYMVVDKAVINGILKKHTASSIKKHLKKGDTVQLRGGQLVIYRSPERITYRKGRGFTNLDRQRIYKEFLTDKEEGLITKDQQDMIERIFKHIVSGRVDFREGSRLIGLINSGILRKMSITTGFRSTTYKLYQIERYPKCNFNNQKLL